MVSCTESQRRRLREAKAGSPEPEFIQAMSVLALRPGDTVVLKTGLRLSREQASEITQVVKAHPAINGHEVLILSDGLDIGVLRQEI